MKIDIFAHILPKKYFEGLRKKAKEGADFSRTQWVLVKSALSDIDIRLRIMDRYPDVLQVLSVVLPPLETVVTPKDAIELARIANDEMAEIVVKYPDRFIGAVACLPLNDIGAAVQEADRAITELGFVGAQIFSNIDGEPLDAPKFRVLYERMAQHDLPIWIHPWNDPAWDWSTPFQDSGMFGWPYQTSLAMVSLVRAGVFEDYPDIKFITHHGGGMVPFFEQRISVGAASQKQKMRVDNLRKFFNDTALYGCTAGLMCAYAYFGADHLVFGTDAMRDSRALEVIQSIERMEIPDKDKEKIFLDNARKLLKLSI